MATLIGPFVASVMHQIAGKVVEQWSRPRHAQADPINLSYWVTYVVPPGRSALGPAGGDDGDLRILRDAGRCADLRDTLWWMVIGLFGVVALNVLVDGYFYLYILLLWLMYTCSAAEFWRAGGTDVDTAKA